MPAGLGGSSGSVGATDDAPPALGGATTPGGEAAVNFSSSSRAFSSSHSSIHAFLTMRSFSWSASW